MMPFQKGLKEALFILMGMALLGLWDTSHAQGVTIIAQSTFDSGAEGWLVKDLPTLLVTWAILRWSSGPFRRPFKRAEAIRAASSA